MSRLFIASVFEFPDFFTGGNLSFLSYFRYLKIRFLSRVLNKDGLCLTLFMHCILSHSCFRPLSLSDPGAPLSQIVAVLFGLCVENVMLRGRPRWEGLSILITSARSWKHIVVTDNLSQIDYGSSVHTTFAQYRNCNCFFLFSRPALLDGQTALKISICLFDFWIRLVNTNRNNLIENEQSCRFSRLQKIEV